MSRAELATGAKMRSVDSFWAFLAVLATIEGSKFPRHWKSCKLGPDHNECLREAIQSALPDLAKGYSGLGITPIDPLRFLKVDIEQGNGPVSVDLIFTDMNITGLKDAKIDRVSNDWKTMVIEASAPLLTVKSNYQVKGKVMVLPVHGKGDCYMELEKYTTRVVIHFEDKVVGKKAYYHLKNVDITLDTNPMRLHFNNLFDGNKELGDHFNKFINENWSGIFMELKPAIQKALQQASADMSTRFFAKVPKNEITPS